MINCFCAGLHHDDAGHQATCLWVAAPSGNELALCDECRLEWLIDVATESCPVPYAVTPIPSGWEWSSQWRQILWERSRQSSA
jgi:hypothetical protein